MLRNGPIVFLSSSARSPSVVPGGKDMKKSSGHGLFGLLLLLLLHRDYSRENHISFILPKQHL